MTRPSTPAAGVYVLGDDLSGAAEAGAALLGITAEPPLLTLDPRPAASDRPMITDLDTRYAAAEIIDARVRSALATAGGSQIVLKIDSLLRGSLHAHLNALEPSRRPVVFAPALPVQGRIVRDGVPLIDQVPLAASSGVDAWRAHERRNPPRTVTDALAPLATRTIPAGPAAAALRQMIINAADAGAVAAADAATDADLDRIVEAAWQLPGVRLVGSAGLVAAVGRRLGARSADRPTTAATGTPPAGVLMVVGTGESSARRQVDELGRRGALVLALAPAELAMGTFAMESIIGESIIGESITHRRSVVERIVAGLARSTVVLRLADGPRHHDGQRIADALADLVAQIGEATATPPHLMLTGGHTARTVLDRLGLTVLSVRGAAHYGAVALESPDGRRVITRPGSFGPPDSLALAARYLADWP